MDDPASSWHVFLIGVLLGLSAIFSGSETAFFSLDSLKLKKLQDKDSQKAETVFSLLAAPRKLLISILIGNETVNVAATSIATAFCIDLFGNKGTGLAIAGMLVLILILGEITPKTIAIHHPIKFASRVVYFLNFFHRLITPLRRIIRVAVEYLLKPLIKQVPDAKTVLSEEEFQTLVEIGQAEGVLEKSQHEMIKNALEFTEATIAEVMTPRDDVFCLPIEESFESAVKKIKKKFFSRVPVYEGNLNRIKGILFTKDLLIHQYDINPPQAIRDLLQPPYFASSDEKVVDLLRDFQKNRIHMAIVMSKTGETAGIVSLENLLEELFGEIEDEAKRKARLYRKLGRNRHIVSAMMHVEDFNQRFSTHIDEEEYETLGGILLELYGTEPYPGEKRSFQGIKFTVERLKGRRIVEVLVETSNSGKEEK